MLRRSPFLGFALGAFLGLLATCNASGCTPHERATLRPLVKPATTISCILLRAFASSGTLDEVCATAEELAPFVTEILEARARAADPVSTSELRVAFSLPPPPRRVARRRCVAWEQLSSRQRDAGQEAGGDGAP